MYLIYPKSNNRENTRSLHLNLDMIVCDVFMWKYFHIKQMKTAIVYFINLNLNTCTIHTVNITLYVFIINLLYVI